MPELEIQRRESQGMPWWVWLLIAALVIGLIWWMMGANTGRDIAETPATTTPNEQVAGERQATTTGDLTSAEWLPIPAMRANPDNYFGQSVSGIGTVTETVSDRAFWLEQRGERVLVVMDEALTTAPTLTAGQAVSIRGTVHNPDQMQQVPGVMQLDTARQTMLQGEPAFIEATSIEVQETMP
jgi:hypothetical protein